MWFKFIKKYLVVKSVVHLKTQFKKKEANDYLSIFYLTNSARAL
jgi:hypothetical protein